MKGLPIFIIFSFILAGCITQPQAVQEQPVCSPPYIEYKLGDCCLDANENRICDNDEKVEEPVAIKESEVDEKPKEKKLETVKDILEMQREKVNSYYYIISDSWDKEHIYLEIVGEGLKRIDYTGKKLRINNTLIDGVVINKTGKAMGICTSSMACTRWGSYRKWINLSEEDIAHIKSFNDIILNYKDIPIKEIQPGGMYNFMDTYKVILENGVTILFDENYHFPIMLEDKTNFINYRIESVSFNTVTKKDIFRIVEVKDEKRMYR